MTNYEQLMVPLFARLGSDLPYLAEDEETVPTHQKPVDLRLAVVGQGDALTTVASAHKAVSLALEEQVLSHVFTQTPTFFERLIVDLMLVMGYGARRRDLAERIGRTGDGGVDGIITQDELGLDVILLQAKRLKLGSTVSSSQVRDFIGALETKKATKGIFVTTGSFSMFALEAAKSASHRIRLINGSELSTLMVRHNLGVKPSQSYVFKSLDISYFRSVKE